ncbi:MAG: DUF58 domain-containing protein [Planctomycetes bacterium]|nr:DUF58 domain-containing protein [Planctomycetota bacterium]
MSPRFALLSPECMRLLDRLEIAVWETRRGRPGGSLPSTSLGLGTRFEEHRRYAPGDDLRYLDWNALGRLGEPFTKQFAREEAGRLTLLLDRTASMASDPALESTARSVSALLAYVGLRTGYHVEVIPLPLSEEREHHGLGGFFGSGAVGELGAWIEGVEFGVPAPLFPAVRQAVAGRELGAATFLVSDLADPDAGERILRLLRAHRCQPALVQLFSPLARDPVPLGHRELLDPETGGTLRIRVTPRLRRAFLERLARFHERVRHRCRALGVRHVRLAAGQVADRAMVRRLREGGVLR